MGDEALKGAVREWRNGRGVDVRPASTYEAVTREMVQAMRAEIAEIKNRLNGLLFMVAGAIVIDIIVRLAGLAS
jgi:hypothetical protein